jgi:hypothetical protein
VFAVDQVKVQLLGEEREQEEEKVCVYVLKK